MQSPFAYFKHRAHVSMAISGMADMQLCAPIVSGVGGPLVHPLVSQELTSLLGLHPGPNHFTNFITSTAWDLAKTPLLMHWAYVLLLAGVCVILVRRRAYILLSLAACSVILLLSYTILGIACDFRYAYTLTVASSLLAAWAALAKPTILSNTK